MRLGRNALLLLLAVLPATCGPAALAQQAATPAPSALSCTEPRRELAAIVAILSPPPATPAAHPATSFAEHGHADDASNDGSHADDGHAHAASEQTPIEPIGTPRLLRPELPPGTPVAANMSAALASTMGDYVACANAGDVIGLMSLVSAEFLRHSFGASALTETDLRAYAAAGRPLPPEQHRRLVAIREGRRLSDGRVAALVDTAPIASDNPAAVTTDLVTFSEEDGRLLIDQYLAGVTAWLGPFATPGP